ncbi:MFS transporter [Nocardioides sp.]|uniref:MFS transporter n=1 Tax=Nocardioides sp. TaxID=35761 RepID=UPI002393C871|nr:MFS transporter [Nocardioides sp.]MDE0777964.1 MFS transporter [Nocardioides sp.]
MTPATRDDSRRVSLTLGLLFGIAGMGSSSAAIAVPLIADDLAIGQGTATWTISLYVLMLAVTTAVYGRVSDLLGTRLPLLIGLGLMAGGALMAALAPSFSVLLAARLLQGAGAAAVPTLGVAIINGRYAGGVRGLALGRLAAMAAAVSCLGPLLGGLVESWAGWRAVLALPILGLLVVPFLWRALTDERSFARLDVVGALLVAVSAAGFVLMVQSPSTGRVVLVAGIVLAVVGVPLSAAWVRRHPDGFLPLSVIQNPIVLRNAFAGASVPAGWFALLVAVPAVLLADGWEPWQVGLLLVPSAVIALFVPRLTGPLMEAVGPTRALAFAAVVTTVALGVAALGSALVWPALLAVAVILVTVAFGVGQPALSAAVADGVEPEVRGVALGVSTLVFLVGGSVGSAVVGGLGGVWGIGYGVLVLAVLPVGALAALAPELLGRREGAPVAVDTR